jgi:hypothetical protein
MKTIQVAVFAAFIAGVLPVSSVVSAMPAQAKQCSTERPLHPRSYWSYRLIDGRKCWYEGKPMLSKSVLQWPSARKARAEHLGSEPNVLPANYYNLLDAQASIPNDPDSFEARWRARFLEAVE